MQDSGTSAGVTVLGITRFGDARCTWKYEIQGNIDAQESVLAIYCTYKLVFERSSVCHPPYTRRD